MTREQEEFFEELKRDWTQDPAMAILYARLYWWLVPEEVIGHAQNLYQSVGMHYDIESSVNTSMGCIGGSQVYSSPGVDPDALMFFGMMAQIRYHEGDPPMPEALARHAGNILEGRMDPLDAFSLAGAQIPGYGQLLREMIPLLGDMLPMLRRIGLLFAALAIPRELIPDLLGIEVEEVPDDDLDPESLGDIFERALATARSAFTDQDYARAEQEVVTALTAAVETESPNDDIQALETLTVVAFRSKVAPATIELAVSAIEALNERNSRLDMLAALAWGLTTLAQAYGLSAELDPRLAKVEQSLLGKSIPRKTRFPLMLSAAGALHRTGDDASASKILDQARAQSKAANDQLEIALLDADIHWDNGDRDGAADLLIEALEPRAQLDEDKVSTAVQKLVCIWPEERDGFEDWVDELVHQAANLEEPQKTFYLLTASIAHWREGRYADAGKIAKDLDLDMAEANVPEPMKDMVQQIRASVDALKK